MALQRGLFKKNASTARNDTAGGRRRQHHQRLETGKNEASGAGIRQLGSKWERSAARAQRACAVRARARSLRWPRAPALAKARGRFEARAGGPPSLRLPEGPAPTHGRRRSPPRSPAPRCEVSPGACSSPVRLSGKRARGVWGLRRCCRGCPLLCLTLCRGATSSPGSSSSGIVILVAAETKALGAGLWRGVSELLGVGGGPAGRGGAGFGAGG